MRVDVGERLWHSPPWPQRLRTPCRTVSTAVVVSVGRGERVRRGVLGGVAELEGVSVGAELGVVVAGGVPEGDAEAVPEGEGVVERVRLGVRVSCVPVRVGEMLLQRPPWPHFLACTPGARRQARSELARRSRAESVMVS